MTRDGSDTDFLSFLRGGVGFLYAAFNFQVSFLVLPGIVRTGCTNFCCFFSRTILLDRKLQRVVLTSLLKE